MTDIDTLEPGPALDALVAEKVMGLRLDGDFPIQQDEAGGWDPIDEEDGAGHQRRPCYRTCGDHPMPPYQYEHGSTCRRVVPEYSTDIAAAWEVVEKLRPTGPKLSIHAARLGYDVEYGPGWFVSAPTAPLAICRAALKAIKTL